MSKENTIVAKRLSNGTVVQILDDGSTRNFAGTIDCKRLHSLTDEEVTAAALGDPDAQPLSSEQLSGRRRPRTKTLRRAPALTQEEFALRYHIPIGTLRDWKRGRCEPDQPARACLTVIAHDPQGVIGALTRKHS